MQQKQKYFGVIYDRTVNRKNIFVGLYLRGRQHNKQYCGLISDLRRNIVSIILGVYNNNNNNIYSTANGLSPGGSVIT